MDASHARQLDHELEPHALQVFESLERFERDGLGRAIVTLGGTVACAATSYTVSARRLEVAIATRPAHRGRGLAEVAAASLLYESLQRELVPEWSASNPVSKRLAERLGYRPAAECEVLYLA
jgi:predicted GNAT family acetyltransferase